MASGGDRQAAITIGSKTSTLWVTTLTAGETRLLPDAPYAHLFVATGQVEVERVGLLGEGDALRVTGGATLRISARLAERADGVGDGAMSTGPTGGP